MKNLRTTLPPPGSLVVFEAAGRLLNFTRAGAELGMSQASVSKQIRLLEERLGVTLFRRSNHRALTLTQGGRKLHRAVTMGLDYIVDGINELRPRPRNEEVSVTTTIALASVWLMPRIAKFRAAHPAIDLRVIAADPISDLSAEEIDVGIRYGMGHWPGTRSERLFGIELFPVCSPGYLAGCRPLRSPADLLKHTLLHIDEPNSQDADWAVWLNAVGAPRRSLSGGLRFNNYPLLIQAAVNGQGIALGWGHLIDDLLESGLLVRPLPTTLWLKPAFFVVLPVDVPMRKEVRLFRDWIIEETLPLRAR
jgi:LysR family transcriptional regulator, glycine cleavage system transcriptional activator